MKKTIALASATVLAAVLGTTIPAAEAQAVTATPATHLNLPASFQPSVAYAINDQAADATERQAAARVLAAKPKKTPAWVTAINYADSKRGNWYLWGGTGPKRFDCSGLTMKAFAKAGITIPRVANNQYKTTNIHPKKSQLLPGDLVFYAPKGKSWKHIYHVGLYVGSGMMIHAPRPDTKIRFNKITYMSGYFGATRVWN